MRRQLAERVVGSREDEDVEAIVIGGSAGRGEGDKYSDVDLLIFWRRPPTDDERTRWIAAAGGDLHRLLWIEDERLWFDDWTIGRRDGVPATGTAVEGVHMTVAAVEEGIADIVERFDTDLAKHIVLGQLVHGVPLAGEQLVRTWRRRLDAYPDGLASAMIERHAQIDHFWRFPMFRERRNPVLAASATAEVHERVLHALLAVNRVYFYGFKSLDSVTRRLEVAPADLLSRIRQTYTVAAVDAERMLAELVEETYDLVAEHVPGVDVERLRRIFRYRRPLWGGELPDF
jgi:Nucleotidyltransferase domain